MSLLTNMNFPQAFNHLLIGSKISRAGWNGPGQYVCMQVPDANSKMGVRYCYLHNTQGQNVPWVPSQGDLFAEDWQTV